MFKNEDLVTFKDTKDNRKDTDLNAGQTPVIDNETVNHPNHYNQGIEAIDVIESWDLNFSLGNAIKYILRAPYKGKELEDLKKASWYINREIERLKNLPKMEL